MKSLIRESCIPCGDLCENWPDGQCPFWAEHTSENEGPDACTNPELKDSEVRSGRQRTAECLKAYPYGGTVTIEPKVKP